MFIGTVILCSAGAVMCVEGRALADCALSSRACCSGSAHAKVRLTRCPDNRTGRACLVLVNSQSRGPPSHADFKVFHRQPACSRTPPSQHAAGTPAQRVSLPHLLADSAGGAPQVHTAVAARVLWQAAHRTKPPVRCCPVCRPKLSQRYCT